MTTFRHIASYRRFAFIYTLDIVVEWFAAIALMAIVYAHSGSATAVALLLVAKQVVPGALVPVLGGRLEVVRPKYVLVGALVTQAAAFGVLSLSATGAAFLVLAGISGLAGGIVRSSIRAAMARGLSDDELTAGNAFLNISLGVAGVAGPVLAAAVVSAASASLALVVAALLLLALVVCVPRLRLAYPADESAADQADADDAASSADAGSRSLGLPATVSLTGLFVLVATVTAAFSMDDPALLDFSEQALGAGVGGYAAITLAWGLGITVGGVVYTRLTRFPLLWVYAAATGLAGVGYIGLGTAPSIEVALAFALIGGVGNGMDWVAIVTLIQRAAPAGRETWAATRLEAIATAAPGLGILAGGLLADSISARAALVAPGVIAIAAIVLAAIATHLRRRPQVAPEQTLTPSIHGGTA